MAEVTNVSGKGAAPQAGQAAAASKPEPKPTTTTRDYFLKIDGVNGESTDDKHKSDD